MATTADVYFASNRNFNGSLTEPEFGERFNEAGPQYYRVGKASVERRGRDDYAFLNARVEAEALDQNVRGSQSLFEDVRHTLRSSDRDIVLFLHGFANTFESGMERAAQLHAEYQITRHPGSSDPTRESYRPPVFAFSWPSNGRVFPRYEYQSDRDDAQASGVAVARALLRLLKYLTSLRDEERVRRRAMNLQPGEPLPDGERLLCEQRIHLVAHSMGNWTLRFALNRLFEELRMQPLPRIFEHVLLMAADEDDDAFEEKLKLGLLPGLAKFVHVYHSRSDRILDVSDLTKGNPNRLGEVGPRNMEAISDRVYAIDCSDVDFTEVGHGNHQYYRLREEVIADVRQVLSDKPFDAIAGRVRTSRSRSYRILPRGND
ncbi:MAG: alpha/beta hydrolase [Rhodospirillales bacterium]|nr:alpha/beta hydrolase [Rhodospirillales bacterium]